MLKYTSVMKQAIQYIETHLYEDIGLYDVADAVGYSYYHMTRLFASSIKESVGSYIRKRRLYEASKRLIYSDEKIITIAMDSGFDSSEAFSRAFKLVYGDSPSKYRKNGLHLVSKAKKAIEIDDISHITENIELTPEIVCFDQIDIMGIRGNTSLHNNKAPQLWAEYMRLTKDCLKDNAKGYSVCETNEAIYTKEDELNFSIMIGSPISDYIQSPEGLHLKTMVGGKYAVFTHHGSFEKLPVTYDYIWGIWAMTSNESLDDREEFEIHEKNDITGIVVKICIPIK
ncbi:MAG: GyrI-like domain-containing protein [Coprobacillaceae bacterium]